MEDVACVEELGSGGGYVVVKKLHLLQRTNKHFAMVSDFQKATRFAHG